MSVNFLLGVASSINLLRVYSVSSSRLMIKILDNISFSIDPRVLCYLCQMNIKLLITALWAWQVGSPAGFQLNSPFAQPTVHQFPSKNAWELVSKALLESRCINPLSAHPHIWSFLQRRKAAGSSKIYSHKSTLTDYLLAWKLIPRGHVSCSGTDVKPTLPGIFLAVL